MPVLADFVANLGRECAVIRVAIDTDDVPASGFQGSADVDPGGSTGAVDDHSHATSRSLDTISTVRCSMILSVSANGSRSTSITLHGIPFTTIPFSSSAVSSGCAQTDRK